jgi:hypothetical protein
MGGFYTNYTLRVASKHAVASALAGRNAFITPEINGCVVAFDEESDNQDQEAIGRLASQLSSSLHCSVFAVLDHDDDILWYQLYVNGKLADEYDSTPGYFDASAPAPPAGGNAELLSAVFGTTEVAAVEQILRRSSHGKDGYVFASERHADLVRALELPEIAVSNAYASFDKGYYRGSLSLSEMMRTRKA